MTWLSFIQGWFWLEIEITGNQWINNWNHRHFLLSKRSTWLVLTVYCNFWRKERKKIDEIGWITEKKSSLFIKLFLYKVKIKNKDFFSSIPGLKIWNSNKWTKNKSKMTWKCCPCLYFEFGPNDWWWYGRHPVNLKNHLVPSLLFKILKHYNKEQLIYQTENSLNVS